MSDMSEREKAQAAMADAVRRIGEAHAAMAATLARMVEGGESTADRDAGELHALSNDLVELTYMLADGRRAWRWAVRDEHTRAALAKAQGRGDG